MSIKGTIKDSKTIQEITTIINTGDQIDAPADTSVSNDLSLGILTNKIYIYYQLLTDVDGNAYIYDTVTGDTWKISSDLAKTLGVQTGNN